MQTHKIKNLALSETGFLFDPATGNTFTLNASAVFIVQALKRGWTSAHIALSLCEEFDVSEEQAREDVGDAIMQLREAGLLSAEAC